MEFQVFVRFSQTLNDGELNALWQEFIAWLEKNELRAGGGESTNHIDWVISPVGSYEDPSVVKEKITSFLSHKQELIGSFTIDKIS